MGDQEKEKIGRRSFLRRAVGFAATNAATRFVGKSAVVGIGLDAAYSNGARFVDNGDAPEPEHMPQQRRQPAVRGNAPLPRLTPKQFQHLKPGEKPDAGWSFDEGDNQAELAQRRRDRVQKRQVPQRPVPQAGEQKGPVESVVNLGKRGVRDTTIGAGAIVAVKFGVPAIRHAWSQPSRTETYGIDPEANDLNARQIWEKGLNAERDERDRNR